MLMNESSYGDAGKQLETTSLPLRGLPSDQRASLLLRLLSLVVVSFVSPCPNKSCKHERTAC